MNLRLKLCFLDRIGIVADLSSRISEKGFNIVAMEVIRQDSEAHVYVELEDNQMNIDKEKLLDFFNEIDGIFESRVIDFLPSQERENRIKVVLDNMSEGVFSVDRQGKITIINRIACQSLGVENDDIVGKHISNLPTPTYPILECLRAGAGKTVEQDFNTPNGRLKYISTCRLIRDENRQIIGALEIAKDVREIKRLANTLLKPEKIDFSDIVGKHEAINQAISYAKKISDSDAVITIIGESGTGKELFARAIHSYSKRPGPFIAVNCAALPEQLLESELFGYSAGAFTGGKREGSAGLFEKAKDGTIFLDEIAELSAGAQAKLLRLIQERAVRRIGSSREVKIDARLITATNKNLENLVAEKKFRQDLYYRICVLPIHIPPLRERIEDVPLLVSHFLYQMTGKLDHCASSASQQALLILQNYDWPGNIRELKNVIDRAAILCEDEIIDTDMIILGSGVNSANRWLQDTSFNISPTVVNSSLKMHTAALEKDLIQKALKSAPSIRQAAKYLGISHPGLIKKMRKHDIQRN